MRQSYLQARSRRSLGASSERLFARGARDADRTRRRVTQWGVAGEGRRLNRWADRRERRPDTDRAGGLRARWHRERQRKVELAALRDGDELVVSSRSAPRIGHVARVAFARNATRALASPQAVIGTSTWVGGRQSMCIQAAITVTTTSNDPEKQRSVGRRLGGARHRVTEGADRLCRGGP